MNTTDWRQRTELLIKKEGVKKLAQSHVVVFGLGGVGAYAAEQICRAGISEMTIIDGDIINATNLNRQLPALTSTLGESKVQIMAERLKDINPNLKLHTFNSFIADDMESVLLTHKFDYVVDAIDSLTPKIHLIHFSIKHNLPIVSSLGAGGKLDPSQIQIVDISKTYNCRLAHRVRKCLRKFDIHTGFQVVFSPEQVDKEAVVLVENERNKKSTVGTISYMPALFGCFCASVAIRALIH